MYKIYEAVDEQTTLIIVIIISFMGFVDNKKNIEYQLLILSVKKLQWITSVLAVRSLHNHP